MSDHTSDQVETPREHVAHSLSAEPPIESLSDEALENVAGGCQVGDSSTGSDPYRPVPFFPDCTI